MSEKLDEKTMEKGFLGLIENEMNKTLSILKEHIKQKKERDEDIEKVYVEGVLEGIGSLITKSRYNPNPSQYLDVAEEYFGKIIGLYRNKK